MLDFLDTMPILIDRKWPYLVDKYRHVGGKMPMYEGRDRAKRVINYDKKGVKIGYKFVLLNEKDISLNPPKVSEMIPTRKGYLLSIMKYRDKDKSAVAYMTVDAFKPEQTKIIPNDIDPSWLATATSQIIADTKSLSANKDKEFLLKLVPVGVIAGLIILLIVIFKESSFNTWLLSQSGVNIICEGTKAIIEQAPGKGI